MSEILQGGAVFNALDGSEVAKAVAAQVTKRILEECANDSNFLSHLTYPVVEWDFELTVRAYPHDPGSFKARVKGRIDPPKVTIIKGGQAVDSSSDEKTPDAARAAAGIPISRPEKTSAGILADVEQPLQEKRG